MRILIVGAGAVGQVYARHLQLGGAEIGLYVKPKYRDACAQGLTLYPFRERDGRKGKVFRPASIHTELEGVRRTAWDQVWICTSSPALRTGWLEGLANAVGNAIVVNLTPGPDDDAYIQNYVPEERLVRGLIVFIAYQAPLPGESWPQPGIAYWLPPLAATPFSGVHADSVIESLNRGGLRAKHDARAVATSVCATAVFMPLIAALEGAGWQFKALRREWLGLASRAAREAVAIVCKRHAVAPPVFARCVHPLLGRLATHVSRWMLPFDIEVYLRYHFTKVGDQTRELMQGYAREGRALGLPTAALEELIGRALVSPPTAGL